MSIKVLLFNESGETEAPEWWRNFVASEPVKTMALGVQKQIEEHQLEVKPDLIESRLNKCIRKHCNAKFYVTQDDEEKFKGWGSRWIEFETQEDQLMFVLRWS